MKNWEYEKTPLACLSDLADHLGVKGIYVKDESWRFGLNAFKGLGGSHAVCVLAIELFVFFVRMFRPPILSFAFFKCAFFVIIVYR